MKRREKTQAEIRRANRGNVPGVLGMAEMAMLSGAAKCKPCEGTGAIHDDNNGSAISSRYCPMCLGTGVQR